MIGKVEKVIYQNDDFVVAVFKTDTETLKIAGKIPEVLQGDIEGLTFEIEGEYEFNKYGKTFKLSKATLKENPLYFFLSKMVEGLTEKIIKEIFSTFKDVEYIIENEPEKLLQVKGIGKKRYQKIMDSYERYKPLKELSEFLLPLGVSASKIIKIYETFGGDKDVISQMKENPYILTEIDGIGFLTADKIASNLGVSKKSGFRYEKAIEYVLEEAMNTEGHTYLTYEQLIKRLKKLEVEDERLIQECLEISFDIEFENGRIYFYRIKKIEEAIVKKLFQLDSGYVLLKGKVDRYLEEFEDIEDIVLTEKQKSAVNKLKTGKRLFILSGYAGTGKTTTLKAIMHVLSKVYCRKEEIIGCAFTGIASDRLRTVTGFNAKTIHSLLEWDGKDFRYGRKEKLPYKVIVLDEATMVDVFLFNKLLEAIGNDTMLILVGDPAQLPPISAGNVFVDIVESGIFDMVKLDKIMRTSKDNVITLFANKIRNGIVPEGYYSNRYKDFYFIRKKLPSNYFKLDPSIRAEILDQSNKSILESIKKTITRLMEKEYIKDVIKDVQIISPMNKGILGTENINREIQAILNSSDIYVEKSSTLFKLNDKVIHINKNMEMPCYKTVPEKPEKEPEFYEKIYNGMIGTIAHVDVENEVVYVKYLDNYLVKYSKSDLKEILNLAYAITIHKSQGSEYSNVIIPMTLSHYNMLNNQLLYTAITRAKKRVILIGHTFAFEKACKSISKTIRNTHTKLILEEMAFLDM